MSRTDGGGATAEPAADLAEDPSSDVLFVCSGNRCRSPMAEHLLAKEVTSLDGPRAAGPALLVTSAGFAPGGQPCPEEVVQAMAYLGLDLSGHRSRTLSPETVSGATLVVGMTRQHVIDLMLLAPDHWRRVFGFSDLLRRASRVGRRGSSETLRAWAARLGDGRERRSVLELPAADDVPDPFGGTRRGYQRSRDRLAQMCSLLARFAVPA